MIIPWTAFPYSNKTKKNTQHHHSTAIIRRINHSFPITISGFPLAGVDPAL
jgi:hypothetical protein